MVKHTGNIATDQFLMSLIFGIGYGMSGHWWRVNHNKHHAMPQKVGHDTDLNTLPLVAFTGKVRNIILFVSSFDCKEFTSFNH